VSEMRQQRGAGVVCGLLNGVVMGYGGKVGLGLVGYMQGLWLGKGGGGVGVGGSGGCIGQEGSERGS
jgi:hypothetical protein